MPASFTSDTSSSNGLIAGNASLLKASAITLISGQNLTRGALLGQITASGKWTLSLSASADGSQTPKGVLVEDTNASAGDAAALIYERGDFQISGMTIGASHTVASIKDALAARGIFLFKTQGGV